MDNNIANDEKIAGQLDLSANSAIEYLDRAMPILRDNLGLQRSANPEGGMDILSQSVDGLQWMMEFLQIAAEATAGHDEEASSQFKSLGHDLFNAVQLLVDAIEKKDFPLLADITEFELLDALSRLREFLAKRFAASA